MKTQTMNACWKKLWPEAVNDYEGFAPDEVHHSAVNKAVMLAKVLGGDGFDDITEDEVEELIEEHGNSLSDQDLEELTRSGTEDECDEDDEEAEDIGLNLDRLGQVG